MILNEFPIFTSQVDHDFIVIHFQINSAYLSRDISRDIFFLDIFFFFNTLNCSLDDFRLTERLLLSIFYEKHRL